MKCEIIEDLLPLYIDEVCHEETAKEVMRHLEQCQQCQQLAQFMTAEHYIAPAPIDVKKARAPFKRINKKRYTQVIIAILTTCLLSMITMQVIRDVGVLNDFFFPMSTAIAAGNTETWTAVSFSENGIASKTYLEYPLLFSKKELVNASEQPVWVRVKNEQGQIIVKAQKISGNRGIDLHELKRTEKYYVEIKQVVDVEDHIILNAV